jgi:hypothetical protein
MVHFSRANPNRNRRWVLIAFAVGAAAMLQVVPPAQAQTGKFKCGTLLSAKELAQITGLAAQKDPEQDSSDDPSSKLAQGVVVCTYQVPGIVVALKVYSGPSVRSVFDTLWKNKKGTALAGIGDEAYFDESGLDMGLARAKGLGVAFQVESFVKSYPPATKRSWTEQILKLVIGRL